MGTKQFKHHIQQAFKGLFSPNTSNVGVNINWTKDSFNLLSMDDKIKLFQTNPTLLAGLNKMSMLFSSMRFETVDKEGKPKESKGGKHLIEILENPNFFQNKEEFLSQWLFMTILEGGVVVNPFTSSGFNKKPDYVEALINCPMSTASMNVINYNNYETYKEAVETAKVQINVLGNVGNYDYKDLIPMYDIGLDPNKDNLFCPFSRLSTLKWSLSNINTANESSNVMADNPAGFGILSPGLKDAQSVVPMNTTEQEIFDKKVKEHGTTKGKKSFITATVPMSYTDTRGKYTDLGLGDIKASADLDVIRVLDIPKELFSIDASKYENHKVIELRWIQGSIQNLADTFCSNLTNYFDLKSKDVRLVAKYDHLPCFTEKNKEKAEALKVTAEGLKVALESDLMTPEEAKEIMKKLTGISYE